MVKEIFIRKKIFNIFLANSLSNFNFGNTNIGKNAENIFLLDKKKFLVSSKKKETASVEIRTYKIFISYFSNLTFRHKYTNEIKLKNSDKICNCEKTVLKKNTLKKDNKNIIKTKELLILNTKFCL